jgi:DNA-binding SARP family transcriptional activator
MIEIHLLGSPQLLRAGHPLNLSRRKSRALLYYLAAHTQPLTREHLLNFFWPDADRASAQQTLRTTLSGLRKLIGDALLISDDTLTLTPTVEVDVREFGHIADLRLQIADSTSQSAISNLQSAIHLYRGDFLADFTLPDSPEFEHWILAERERYRRMAVRGWTMLSQWHEADDNYADALNALEHALTFDALQEDVQREALRLHYLAGDRAGAIRRYEKLVKLLDEEMGVPPMAETRALYDAIITDKLQIPTPKSASPKGDIIPNHRVQQTTTKDQRPTPQSPIPNSQLLPFVGRADELQQLHAHAFDHQLILIEGEAGIGKTRLVEEFIRASDATDLLGKAHELEHTLPYHPIVEAMRGWLAQHAWVALKVPSVWLHEVARLLPELGEAATTTTADESRLWEGLYQFLSALAQRQRMLLCIDDAQWADASTLALLGYLVRRAAATNAPIGVLATMRPVETRSPLATFRQALQREGRLHHLSVRRLSDDELTQLAQQLSPTYAQPLTHWLRQSSEGNPYILSEMVREAREQNVLQSDGTLNLSALPTTPVVPQTVYGLIQARLARLSDAARRVLDAGVAAGREFEFAVIAHAAGLSEDAALDALDELRAYGLVTERRDVTAQRLYTFDHSLTMEVAYREVSETRHRLLHRRVAEAMEAVHRQSLDAVAGVLAQHFAEGHTLTRAAPYALRAAQQAVRVAAWHEAIAFYLLALQGTDDAQCFEILMALGDARFQAGQFASAAETCREALRLAQTHDDTTELNAARLQLASTLIEQARYAEMIELAQQVLATGQPTARARAEFLWGTALSLEGADLSEADAHLQKAEAEADELWLSQVKFERGSVAAQLGDLPQAIAFYREALASATVCANPTALGFAVLSYNNLAYHLHLLGDSTALAHAQKGLQLAQENGVLAFQPYLLSTLGEIKLAQNDVEAAEYHFTEALSLAEQFAIPERLAGLTANLGLVALQRGQTTLAIHHLSTALARAEALGTRHLTAKIHIWLAPLLPPAERQSHIAAARAIAASTGRRLLLEEVQRLEQK